MEVKDYLRKHIKETRDCVAWYFAHEPPPTDEQILEVADSHDAFLIAGSFGDLEYCKYLLSLGDFEIDEMNDADVDILDYVGDDQIHVYKWAVESGGFDDRGYQWLFKYAIREGNIKCAKWIVERYDVDIYANHDEALRACHSPKSRECAEWLIKNGADIHTKNDELYKTIKHSMEWDDRGRYDEHFKWISSFGGH